MQISDEISPPDEEYRRRCEERWNSLCKPIHGFGALEDIVAQIGAIQRTDDPKIDRTAVVIMGADNGVVAEGVSQCGSEVTAQVLRNMAGGKSSVCVMSKFRKADIFPVDIGLSQPAGHPGVCSRAVRRGTGDIMKGPAMSREEAEKAIEEGIRIAGEIKQKGYNFLIPGEMGIGNTATSTACVCALFRKDPAEITGPGAGLTKEGVRRKAEVIRRALIVNGLSGKSRSGTPEHPDAIGVLAKVGGLDIAGMTGLFLGAARESIPAVIDGFIAALAAYIAAAVAPAAKAYMIPSHGSTEPGDRILMDALGMKPVLDLGMHLGEGTGAAALLPLLDQAFFVYRELPVFGEAGVKAYRPLT